MKPAPLAYLSLQCVTRRDPRTWSNAERMQAYRRCVPPEFANTFSRFAPGPVPVPSPSPGAGSRRAFSEEAQ